MTKFTSAEIIEVAAITDKKIKLEKTVTPEIKRLFRNMSSANFESILTTGYSLSASEYQDEWEVLLRNHYIKVQKKFIDKEEENNELLILTLLRWRQLQVKESSALITKTNQKDIKKAENDARSSILKEQNTIDNKTLALVSTSLIRKKFGSRVSAIAVTETQGPAEVTRFADALIKADIHPNLILEPRVVITTATKSWATMGDDRVRYIHVKADGQTVKLTESFVIDGERLNFPRDGSLGATAKNLVKCRCSVVYRG